MTKAIPISRTAHQYSVTNWTIVNSVSGLKRRFFSLTNGPSASTFRHFRKTSQYPWKLSQGEPGRRLKPSEEMFNRPDLASSAVDIQVLFLPGFWHANSQSWRLLDTVSDVKKQEISPNLTHMESLHSPCWQTWVPWLHSVTLSGFGSGFGHVAFLPLQNADSVQSSICLHLVPSDLSVNLQSLSQHGPSLGEHSAKGFRLQRFSVAQAACSSGDNVVGPCLG